MSAPLARTSFVFTEDQNKRMRDLSEKFDISFSRLFCCLMAQPDEAIKALIDANYDALFNKDAEKEAARQARALKKEEEKKRRKEAISALKALPPEKIEAMLAQLKE